MSYANIVEITQCLDDCIAYSERHAERPFVREHAQRLVQTRAQFRDAIDRTDRHFAQWRKEQIDDRLAWKHLAGELRTTQDRLKRLGAADYPATRTLYWDKEILVAAVEEMTVYLRQHRDEIEFAPATLDKFERLLQSAFAEGGEADGALKNYHRFISFRADALVDATNTIAVFRAAARAALGVDHEEYRQIHWPFAVATDDRVL